MQTTLNEKKIPLSTDLQGNILCVDIGNCWEVLRRLAVRNMDPTSPDFESLTWVQQYALFRVLEQKGIRPGRARMPGQEEESEA